MHRYIGLDVHSQSCTVVVVGPSGRRMSQDVLPTLGAELVSWIRGVPGQRHLCFEEGTHSEWLHELLEPHVAELKVVMPQRRDGVKTDAKDAAWLAEQLRIGAVKSPVYKAPSAFAMVRCAARGYRAIVQDIVRVKNRLKAVLRSRGLQATDAIYDPTKRETILAQLPAAHHAYALTLATELDSIQPLLKVAESFLLRASHAHPSARILETAPGIGPIRAAMLLAYAMTPHRFRTRQQFFSYCGLGIVMRSSSDWVQSDGQWERARRRGTRGLSRRRHPVLKNIFKGAAMTVAQSPGLALHADYQRLLERTKPNLAQLTIARRIAAMVLSMWKNQEAYDPTKHTRSHKT